MVGRTPDFDRGIGERVRTARLTAGLTQKDLADQLGIRFQQVQKYEKGQNRISASTLFKVAEVLKTDLLYFLTGGPPGSPWFGPIGFSGATTVDFEILRSLVKIKDPKAKRVIANLAKILEARPPKCGD